MTILNEAIAYRPELCADLLSRIRTRAPLIHHITNWVTINDCAQVTRCVGALPVMAHMREEVAEMVQLASALVLNIGTLSRQVVESMLVAGKAANAKGIPVILDIVGCGATAVRTETFEELNRRLKLAVIKGNAGEVGAAAGVEAVVKGVESVSVAGDIEDVARNLARNSGAVVVVTGAIDTVTDGVRLHRCDAGHPLMGQVVGTGCMFASVLGAFAAVADNPVEAAVCAVNFYGQAGIAAGVVAATPLAFKIEFMDSVYRLAAAQSGVLSGKMPEDR